MQKTRNGLLALLLSTPSVQAATTVADLRREFPDRLHRTVRLSDGDTHFDDKGPVNGPVVVLLHGVSGPMDVWDRTVPALVAAGFRVIRYDLYGRGMSDRPAHFPHRLDDYLRQLEELLTAREVTGPLFLAGSSFGAMLATEYTLHHPERVAALGLVGPAGFPISVPPLARLRDVPLLGNVLFWLAGRRTIREQNRKYFFTQPPPPELWPYFERQLAVAGTAEAMRDTMRGAPVTAYLPSYTRLGESKVPVTVVWGKEDVTFPFEHCPSLLSAVPQAQATPVEKAGHLPQWEGAETTNEALLRFFRAHRDAARASEHGSLRLSFPSAVDHNVSPSLLANEEEFTAPFFTRFAERSYQLTVAPNLVKTYAFPTFYADVVTSIAAFSCDWRGACALLAGTGYEPVRTGPGRAAAVLSSYRYRRVRGMAPYSEAAVAIPAVPLHRTATPVLPLLHPKRYGLAAWIAWMPVTTLENKLRGREIWGLPKDVVAIDLRATGDEFVTTVFDDEQRPVFRFSVPRTGRAVSLEQETTILSRRDGSLLQAPAVSEGAFVVHTDVAALARHSREGRRLQLGPSPRAALLRDLDLDTTPFRTQFGEHVRSAFTLPS